MRKGIGSHQSANMKTDEWLTPPSILKALGPFDLDPCASKRLGKCSKGGIDRGSVALAANVPSIAAVAELELQNFKLTTNVK